jgi:hypothetical protein
MELIIIGCENCFYYCQEDRRCRAKEACIGAGSYKSWEAKYKCPLANTESGRQCEFFVKPGFCVEVDEKWCRRERDDLVYEDKDNGDSMSDKIKKMKEMFR